MLTVVIVMSIMTGRGMTKSSKHTRQNPNQARIALDKHQVVKGQRLKSGWSIPINQKSLATGCNVGRETLNRKLRSLESEGYIQSRQVGRNKIYRLTAYVVSGAQVLEMQNNASAVKVAVSGRADCRDSHGTKDRPKGGINGAISGRND